MAERNDITNGRESAWEIQGVGISFEPKRTPTGDKLDAVIEWLLSEGGNMVEGEKPIDKRRGDEYPELKLVKGNMVNNDIESGAEPTQEEILSAAKEAHQRRQDSRYLKELSAQESLPTYGTGAQVPAAIPRAERERIRENLTLVEAPVEEPVVNPAEEQRKQEAKRSAAKPRVSFGKAAVATGLTVLSGVAGFFGIRALSGGGEQQPTPAAGGANAPTAEATNQPEPTADPTVEAVPTGTPLPTEAPKELTYAEKVSQAPVDVSVSPSLGFEKATVVLPGSVRASRDLALLHKAGQLEPYPANPIEAWQRLAALGENGADFGGIDPTKGIKITVIDYNTEGKDYSLEVTRTTGANVPIIGVALSVKEDGSVEYIIGVNPNNMMELVRGIDQKDRWLEVAIDDGIQSASKFVASGMNAESLQGEEWNRAVKYVDFLNNSNEAFGIGPNDGTNMRNMIDITGSGK